jgi:hypothetical protein
LKYAKRTKFQRRREAFYSVCDEGSKSKVAICKSDKRPTWVHNLETLKTKQLRQQLKGFLKNLGILGDPKFMNIPKLVKAKNWHHVVYLDDMSKTGGSGRGGPPRTPANNSNRAAAEAPSPVRQRPDRQRRGRSAPVSRRATRASEYFQQTLPDDLQPEPHDSEDDWPITDDQTGRPSRKRRRRDQGSRPMKRTRLDTYGGEHHEGEQQLETRMRRLEDANAEKLLAGGGGGDNVQVLQTGPDCFFDEEKDEENVCKPYTLKHSKMGATTRKKLKGLAEERAITCAKIALLRCLTVEFQAQAKLWRKFNANCQGDYLAPFSQEKIKELMCGKQAVFGGTELHTLKGVSQCYNLSQNLCKGYRDSTARFSSEKAIDHDYTLGHLCYDELLANVRKFGDPWSLAAFRQRYPDPVERRTLICTSAEGTQIKEMPVVRREPIDPGLKGYNPSPTIVMPSGGGGGGRQSDDLGAATKTKINVNTGGSRLRGGNQAARHGMSSGISGGRGPMGPPGPPGASPPVYAPPGPLPLHRSHKLLLLLRILQCPREQALRLQCPSQQAMLCKTVSGF